MTAIQTLRVATRDVHQRLHHNPAFAPIMQDPPDPAGYVRLLRQLHGFHAPAEAALFNAAATLLPELDDLPARRKAHLLADDLAALAPFYPEAGQPPEGGSALPATLTRPAVLGALYVTEGATLGGRDLGRRLEPALQALGLAGRRGRDFFLAYDPHQGAMWRRFCATLEAAAVSFGSSDSHTMATAAHDMFIAMEHWLRRGLTPA